MAEKARQAPQKNAFEARLANIDKVISKREAYEAKLLKQYKYLIRSYRLNLDRIWVARVIFEKFGQASLVTCVDLAEKGTNKTKKLANDIRNEAVEKKFGTLKAADCVAQHLARRAGLGVERRGVAGLQ